MRSLLICAALFFYTLLAALPPTVSNVRFAQREDGSKIVDIYYDLASAEDVNCEVEIALSADGGASYPLRPDPLLLMGDYGTGVAPGADRHIWWFAGGEDSIFDGQSYRFKIYADDGFPPLVPDDFVSLPGRTFQMGRTQGDGDTDELPVHNVTLSPFAICKYEVTQSEWQAIMGSNPAHNWGVGPDHPVYFVSWYGIIKYCNLRSLAEGYTPAYSITGSTDPLTWGEVPAYDSPAWNAVFCNWDADGYRLPTDAEWEFAARGGTNDPDYLYSGGNIINAVAWNDGNASVQGCKPVGTKLPNSLGIHDMSGNLWEYCWDWLDAFTGLDETDPTGPVNGFLRLARGGYWLNLPQQCRVYERSGYYAFEGNYWMGFRVAKSLPGEIWGR